MPDDARKLRLKDLVTIKWTKDRSGGGEVHVSRTTRRSRIPRASSC